MNLTPRLTLFHGPVTLPRKKKWKFKMDPTNSSYLFKYHAIFHWTMIMGGKSIPTLHPLVHDCCFTALFVLFTASGVEKCANAVHDNIFHPLLVGGRFACVATFEAAGGGFPRFTEASVLWGNQWPVCSLLVLKNPSNCLIVIKLSGYFCAFGRYLLLMKYIL